MNRYFVERPVLSIVISLIIILVGVLSLLYLPVTRYPKIAPPKVVIVAEFTGANAETCIKTVVNPLELAINGVPGMSYITSDAGNDGVSTVQIIFEEGTNADIAAVNIQNRVASITGKLPPEVIKNGIKITKEENAMLMYINVFSNDDKLDEKFLYNFADLNILAELKRIKGVGFIDILGQREYAIRVWLKPDKLLTYKLSPDDIVQAINDFNVEAAPGKVGESSDMKAQPLQYVLKYTGRYSKPEQFESIPLKSNVNGKILHLKDVAKIEFSSTYYDVQTKINGRPSAGILIEQAPGSNASTTVKALKKKMEEIKGRRFIEGMDYELSYDVSRFLDASIHEVTKTLIEAFLLVALVVFLFLQDIRSTIVPVLAVPVSLIGAFIFLKLFGFSVNLITLFAFVLAIGIVVDDAIVVVEAVHSKLDHGMTSAKEATASAMAEITKPIIAITLVMSSVFIPAGFIGGPIGTFYKQFCVTLAVSIILSGLVALTFTPALCALILRPHKQSHKKRLLQFFFDKFNLGFEKTKSGYSSLLVKTAGRKLITTSFLLIFMAGVVYFFEILPSGFVPDEDQGVFYANIITPAGSTLERTKDVMNALANEATQMEGVKSISTIAGTSLISDGNGATFGTCIFNLKNWDDRSQSVEEIKNEFAKRAANIQDASIEYFPPVAIPGYGYGGGFELRLLDKSGSGDYQAMEAVTKQFVKDLKARPEISKIFTVFDAGFPQYLINIDMDKAAQKGVSVNDAMSSLQTLIGSDYVSNFIRFDRMYRVMVQALPEYRSKPEDILKLYIKNKDGGMVPYSAFLKLEKVYGLEQISRFNMNTTAKLNGEPAKGYSSGQAIKAVNEVAKTLPRDYDIDWAGITRDELSAGDDSTYIFIISLLFVYLVLSAQYESFLLPLPVIISLPVGMCGALYFLHLAGLENNVYNHLALLMLIGLLGKNAILIIEFALAQQKEGATIVQSAIDGALVRLRPILMTSFAFIAGLLPLVFAEGAGAQANRTIGTAAAGGMLFGTIFGLLIIPGLFIIFASLQKVYSDRFSEKQTQGTAL